MSTGQFYNNGLPPFLIADAAAVTLATTYKALVPASQMPVLGPNFFGWPGKKLRVEAFGRLTTALTPGNLKLGFYFGTGADANGVLLSETGAVALTASQTSLSWRIRADITCRSTGAAGTLFCTGDLLVNEAAIVQHMLMPAALPVVSAACDLTSPTLLISLQANRSGSTAETMQVHDITVSELN